ncbi:MAG: hypothetical protein K0S18_1228 [Anaerocolumna sp.]|jgi:hypothetical protein|nr:hypothetical protein [Anaerocolumna sp.]
MNKFSDKVFLEMRLEKAIAQFGYLDQIVRLIQAISNDNRVFQQ